MNSYELSAILSSNAVTKPTFIGVYSADTLPDDFYLKQHRAIIVVNSETANVLMGHWLVLEMVRSDGFGANGFFFDSYGGGIDNYNARIKAFMRRHCQKIDENRGTQVQSFKTNVCGEYCLYYAYMRTRHVNYRTLLSYFNLKKRYRNDLVVRNFVKQKFQKFRKHILVQHNITYQEADLFHAQPMLVSVKEEDEMDISN